MHLGAGDDVIWPDGWHGQHSDPSEDLFTYDVIHGEDGYDTHIDTWGENLAPANFQ